MYRSPPNLRSGLKGKPVPLQSADKQKIKQSLSVTEVNMSPPPAANKETKVIDPSVIERCVNKYLSGENIFESLVTRLTQELKYVVEDAVRSAMVAANEEINSLRGEVSGLRDKVRQLDEDLKDGCDELEQYQRRNNIRIFGIPETNGEDTDRLVVKLCQEKLGLEIKQEAVSRSHRVGRQPAPDADGRKRHRPIIVRFISYRDRKMVFNAKKKLKGSGVSVREDLTARRQEVYRQAVALHGLHNTWTSDGRVLWIDKQGVKGMATRLTDLKDKK